MLTAWPEETNAKEGLMRRQLSVIAETWPIAGTFTIARGARKTARTVTVTLSEDAHQGRGECVPYPRYGESVDGVIAAIENCREAIERGIDRAELSRLLPAGAARNALDCALWDLEAKQSDRPVHALAGVPPLTSRLTAFTISLASPEAMAEAAAKAGDHALLKIKLGGDGDHARMRAVREAVPDMRLILDANEAWPVDELPSLLATAAEIGAEIVEQPLPAGADAPLGEISRSVPVCADESLHVSGDLDGLRRRYDCVNIKLDKTGGLTEALHLLGEARRHGFRIMCGCMVGTSLSMAPAMLIAQQADFVDLDGPLLLERDREHGLIYQSSEVFPPDPRLWG